MLAIKTGRRPTRSLSRPHSGAVNSDISENVANSAVMASGEAVKRSA